jgi:hypothetical protein
VPERRIRPGTPQDTEHFKVELHQPPQLPDPAPVRFSERKELQSIRLQQRHRALLFPAGEQHLMPAARQLRSQVAEEMDVGGMAGVDEYFQGREFRFKFFVCRALLLRTLFACREVQSLNN